MSTGVDLLPKSAYVDNWTEEERAVAEFVGFTAEVDDPEGGKKVVVAPLGVRSAYLATLQRTGLDPVARQIYLILFNGKWTIHVSIDGLRLTAERGKEYLGQAEPEWWYGEYTKVPHLVDGKVVPLPDGGVLLKDEPVWHKVPKAGVQPTAARVGVFKKGRKKATYGIATWEAYGKNYGQWKKNGPHMLAKCFDPETEVLTNRGFRRFAELGDATVMQVTDSGLVPAPGATPFRQAYTGPMIASHGDMLNFTVTPNHDMVTTVGKVEAGAMLATTRTRPMWYIPLAVTGQRPDAELVSDEDIRLAAAIVADGWMSGRSFRVSASRSKKVSTLREMHPTSTHIQHSSGTVATTNKRWVRSNFDKEVFAFPAARAAALIDENKSIDLDSVLALSPRQIRLFIDEWIQFDGHVGAAGVRRLYTSRVDHLRAAEVLAVAAGYSVNVARERTSDISDRPNFILTISQPKPQPVVRPTGNQPGVVEEAANPSGEVWCVTVPSGKIVVRRNGFSMVVGNCAEALALRKAFPMELGGLYLEDEFADGQAPAEAELEGGRDWEAEIAATKTVEELTKLYEELKADGWTKRLDALARARRAAIIAGETEEVVDAELVPEDAQ